MITLTHPLLGELELSISFYAHISIRDGLEYCIKNAFGEFKEKGPRYTVKIQEGKLQINGRVYEQVSWYGDLNRLHSEYHGCWPTCKGQFTEKASKWLKENITPWVLEQVKANEEILRINAYKQLLDSAEQGMRSYQETLTKATKTLAILVKEGI